MCEKTLQGAIERRTPLVVKVKTSGTIVHEFPLSTPDRQVTALTPEIERGLEETWRAMLRDSEKTFIYGITLLSRLRAEFYISFIIRRGVRGVVVPDEPRFDKAATPYFLSLLGDCRFYLKYGSGASAILAAALNKPLCPLTDRAVLQSLRRKIGSLSAAERLLHADIGLTGPWGILFPPGTGLC
jgi:hypothetical protein